jgi:hypothetical protein
LGFRGVDYDNDNDNDNDKEPDNESTDGAAECPNPPP